MKISICRLAAGAFLLAACGEPADVSQAVARTPSAGQAESGEGMNDARACRVTGRLRPLPDEVHEASGAAASRRHPGVVWTHNDSGDPELFALEMEGRLVARVRVQGAENRDWEDLAAAPCGESGSCLYIADIGDNNADRESITMYRVPEPGLGDAETGPVATIRARYPDGSHDAEALFVLPDGTIHILTKGETGGIALYRLPAGAGGDGTALLEHLRDVARSDVERSKRITGADASADGRWVAVRTLDEASIYSTDVFLRGSSRPVRRADLRALGEPQGEGIAFAGGERIVLTSEGGKKEDPATLGQMRCVLD